MLISDETFYAFLSCETKCHLKSSGNIEFKRDLVEWQRSYLDNYKQKCLVNLYSKFGEDECLPGPSSLEALENDKNRLIADCILSTNGLQSHTHALERSTTPVKRKQSPFIPIRFFPNEKITKYDKLLLAFDALVLSSAFGKMPLVGKIIHGSEQKVTKVELVGLMEMTKAIVGKITAQQVSPTPPPLILNKHCPECEFQSRCRQIAVEKDELTLLSRLTEKERKRQHNKGIFSVMQLSYTFRARRRPKRLASKSEKYSHALKALAIRERKIHIAGRPVLNLKGNPVFLDVEGVPDRDFYYLIGLRTRTDDLSTQYSFWANERSDEKEMWASCLATLAKIDNPQLIHYGGYEAIFLKRMKERYPEVIEDVPFLDRLIAESVNLLSVIYARIYFPTYSNGLKEIAQFLGFQWSDRTISGFNALMWRLQWESSEDPTLKQKLVTYNGEDCEALVKVTAAVIQLCQKQTEVTNAADANIVYTDS